MISTKDLTDKEISVLYTIINNEYQTFDSTDYRLINSPTWTFICEDSGYKGKTLSGIISSLSKRGVIESELDGNNSTIWITEYGFKVLNNNK
jgi:DNA-binding MarR family transcriptional regulator